MASEVRSAPVNASLAGANVIVAAVLDREIVVLGYKILCAGAVTVTWESEDGSVLDGPCAFAANGGESTPETENGHFAAHQSEGLVMNLSAGVQVGGHVKYALV